MHLRLQFRIHTPAEYDAGIVGGTEDVIIILPNCPGVDKDEEVDVWKELVAAYADLSEEQVETVLVSYRITGD